VRLAWAHGSFLEGGAFHDLDIAVQFYGPPSWRDPGLVAGLVWEAIGKPAFNVDVVPLNDAVPFFRRKVADDGHLLLEREAGEASEFGGLAMSEVIELMEWKRLQEPGG
jgi:predicted nucleotidyltransferase